MADRHTRLRDAIRWSRRKLRPFLDINYEMVREFVGKHFGENEEDRTFDRVTVNQLALAVQIHLRNLIAGHPRFMAGTKKAALKMKANNLQYSLNGLTKEVKLKKTIRAACLDALFIQGVVYVGLEDMSPIDHPEIEHGEPYCDILSPDDFFQDMTAKDDNNIDFIGHNYSMVLEEAMEYKGFNANRKKLIRSDIGQGDPDGHNERTSNLEKGSASASEGDYLDKVEMTNVYCPRDNTVKIYAYHQEDLGPLYEEKWCGPIARTGGYIKLSFMDVPGNLMPSAPAAHWFDLHLLSNDIFNKLARQALRQKDQTIYTAASAEDAKNVIENPDGESIRVDTPNGIQKLKSGGIDQSNFGFCMQLKEIFSRQANNLDALGGLGASADTLGQEELITQSSNKIVSEMQDRVADFTQEIGKRLGWYLWDDPITVYHQSIMSPNGQREYHVYSHPKGTPEMRMGNAWHIARDADVYEFDIELEPYSMRHESPASKLAAIKDMLGMFAPFMQQMQADGLTFDWEKIIRRFGEYRNMTDLDDIIRSAIMPAAPAQGGDGGGPTMPAATNRTYTRVNKGGATTQGKDQAMISTLMGANVQQKEKNMIGRLAG